MASPMEYSHSPTAPSPPQHFGSVPDGQTIPAVLFHPGQHPSASDDGQDPKRRRIARACDMCRKKKIKCDGRLPACTHCANYNTECVFTLVEKKRNPPKGAKYIEGLENRLGRMESLLKLSGLLPDDPDGKTDLGDLERRLTEQSQGRASVSVAGRSSSESVRGHTPGSSPMHSVINSPTSKAKDEEEAENLSDMMCSLVTNNCGETRFIGSSSGFSIFSPKGIQWVNEKTGDTSFQDMITNATAQDSSRFFPTKNGVFGQLFENRKRNPMPPKGPTMTLVADFFVNFNNLFPLFHRPTFEYLLNRHFSDSPLADSGWYAALNMVLAIACRLRISHPLQIDDKVAPWVGVERSWQYFQNAAGLLTELLLKNSDLMTIQAILAMSLFMQGTANPQPSYFLIAAAVRLANSIGMHRRGSWFGLSAVEVEQRRRVFWIMYLLDKEIALRSGRPGAINDDDVNVDLPEEDPADGVGNIPLAGGKTKVNLFRLIAQFSTIEGKVYMHLYSAKASRQTDQEILNTIGDLDLELEKWKTSVPIEIRPDNEIKVDEGPLVLHVVMLHFAYHNCLTTIHRMSIHHGYWTSRLSNYAISGLSAKPLNPRVFSSAALCVSAARSSINLIKYINANDCPCIWLIMYYPVSALVTLFANILQNPLDLRARPDLRLMHNVCKFLLGIREEDENGSVTRMLAICEEFDRIAKVVLDKAEKEQQTRRKRKQPSGKEDESDPRPKTPLPVATSTPTPVPSTPSFVSGSTVNSSGGAGSLLRQQQQIQQLQPQQLQRDNSMSSVDSTFDTFSPSSNFGWLGDVCSPAPQQTPGFVFTAPGDSNSPVPNVVDGDGFPAGGYGSIGLPIMTGLAGDSDSFPVPLVPQELWQMPMMLEWDWADLGMGGAAWPMGNDGL
ncbi:fungal-specific transcription factor domain-containing protein [Terfezia claveryi]|nr:fungal-specific transcription factor domain-containing protein [Terfezia claveryi]